MGTDREVPETAVVAPTPTRAVLIKALQGGTSGAMAMAIQVTTLMWMRTTMNYQYRYGTSTKQAMKYGIKFDDTLVRQEGRKKLYLEGGFLRFYRGYLPALAQGPISRFGDTAANAGVLALLAPHDSLPMAVKTGVASTAAGAWRIVIMPIDAVKTTLQVEGARGLSVLAGKIHACGHPFVLWHGALAAASATAVGHFPWFFTFNFLQEKIPTTEEKLKKLGRNAFIGFVASVVSDTISNSLRVVKTTRQTFPHVVSYADVVRTVVKADGVLGLLGRGLKTRLLANGMQGLMFSVLYKYFMDITGKQNEKK